MIDIVVPNSRGDGKSAMLPPSLAMGRPAYRRFLLFGSRSTTKDAKGVETKARVPPATLKRSNSLRLSSQKLSSSSDSPSFLTPLRRFSGSRVRKATPTDDDTISVRSARQRSAPQRSKSNDIVELSSSHKRTSDKKTRKGKKPVSTKPKVRFDSSLDQVHQYDGVTQEEKQDTFYSRDEMLDVKRKNKREAKVMSKKNPMLSAYLKQLYSDEDSEVTLNSLGPQALSILTAQNIRGLEYVMINSISEHKRFFIRNFMAIQEEHTTTSRLTAYMCSQQSKGLGFDCLTKDFNTNDLKNLSNHTAATVQHEPKSEKTNAELEKLLRKLSLEMSAQSRRFAREMAIIDEYQAKSPTEERLEKTYDDYSVCDVTESFSDDFSLCDI